MTSQQITQSPPNEMFGVLYCNLVDYSFGISGAACGLWWLSVIGQRKL
jgi:hypothetical protein